MKKTFILFCTLIFTLTTFAAEFKMINLNTKDISVINTAITQATEANASNSILLKLKIMKGLVEKNVTTFEALKAEVELVVNADTSLSSVRKAWFIKTFVKQFSCVGFKDLQVKRIMVQAAYNYSLENPTDYDIYFYYAVSSFIPLTKEQQYTGILNQFKLYGAKFADPSMTEAAINKFIAIAPTTNVNTQKADLKLLDQIVSPMLLVNKAKYEPIVAKIRTAIETY